MTLLVALLIGIIFGGIVGILFKRGADYIAIDLLLGACGAILGTAIEYFAHLGVSSSFGILTFRGAVSAALGAGFTLLIYQLLLMTKKNKHKTVIKPHEGE